MNVVQPIRDQTKINKMYEILRAKRERDIIFFLLGITVGLRISDLLTLKKEDLYKPHITIVEQKTGKTKRFKISGYIKKYIIPYADSLKEGEYLFKSREGKNKPIHRCTAYKILNTAAKKCHLQEIGTHTLRKTFGYHFYQANHDVVMLQELFNHSTPEVTLRYIGITQDSIDKAVDKVKLI
ncbi:MAG: tyrosine-type recombinase/integrase [Sporolactobacillus sp.]|uniref:tyrosine-type recombinase/integrase n=1 Tax=Sporolactobacillus sp. STSJ-5 TaxID=2965076 RepID=UPI002102C750|nr:tyrosine-type recombinase/integrase [Sporolactobacillus sp. STSJ-5]MCQ2009289.1 tyrosine-type recombinase/integrase [Sporolactobacillus sp. STSJ-5]